MRGVPLSNMNYVLASGHFKNPSLGADTTSRAGIERQGCGCLTDGLRNTVVSGSRPVAVDQLIESVSAVNCHQQFVSLHHPPASLIDSVLPLGPLNRSEGKSTINECLRQQLSCSRACDGF